MLDLSMGRFDSAQNGIKRFLQKDFQNARAHYCLGESYRQRNEEEDREKALEEYNLSATYDPSYPEPHKGAGLIYYKQGLKQAAKAEFEKYLMLSPNADDAGYIQQYIN
jgi:tetratricopeptide (TPR) repeat protein